MCSSGVCYPSYPSCYGGIFLLITIFLFFFLSMLLLTLLRHTNDFLFMFLGRDRSCITLYVFHQSFHHYNRRNSENFSELLWEILHLTFEFPRLSPTYLEMRGKLEKCENNRGNWVLMFNRYPISPIYEFNHLSITDEYCHAKIDEHWRKNWL